MLVGVRLMEDWLLVAAGSNVSDGQGSRRTSIERVTLDNSRDGISHGSVHHIDGKYDRYHTELYNYRQDGIFAVQ